MIDANCLAPRRGHGLSDAVVRMTLLLAAYHVISTHSLSGLKWCLRSFDDDRLACEGHWDCASILEHCNFCPDGGHESTENTNVRVGACRAESMYYLGILQSSRMVDPWFGLELEMGY